jgi:serine/threonine-protein kinase
MQTKCHACGESVTPSEDACPYCGVLLRHTVAQDDTTADADEPVDRGSVVFDPGAGFADRYTIIERLGEGGMGVVYKAIDRTLEADVTLKLIQPAVARNPSFVSRFKREARITRQITHPNVCRVHDIGESGGTLFISMEWIEGETVQQLLRQTGMLSESRALEIASKIAAALAAAHERGIVHRDLKPANVMIDRRRGEVHVLDFGLALDAEAQELTGAGAVVGTPLYMAPEQRAGAPVDARTDVYALGLVLVEMLAGRRVIPDPHLADSLPSEINPTLAPLLRRLLAWRPEDRFDSAAAARDELDRVRADPTLSGFSKVELPAGAKPRPRSLRAPALALAGLAGLTLMALTAVWIVRPFGTPHPVRDPVAREFYEQGMGRLTQDYHTTAGLERARSMFKRAADEEPDSPVILSRIGLVYWNLYLKLGDAVYRDEAERHLRKAAELDPDCPQLRYAKAFGLIVDGQPQAAREELERSLKLDADQPMAWADLASVLWEADEYEAAGRALEESTRRGPGSYRTSVYRGNFHAYYGEYEPALAAYTRATELNPEASVAWNNKGAMLLQLGRPEEAADAMKEALDLEPDAWTATNLGTTYYRMKRWDEAERYYRTATELDPDDPILWSNLADVFLVQDRSEDARKAYARAAEAARGNLLVDAATPEDVMRAAVYHALAGDVERAREYAERAIAERPNDPSLLLKLARVRCAVGEDDEALDAIVRAAERGASRAQIEAYPDLARLASDPRYRRALELASGD